MSTLAYVHVALLFVFGVGHCILARADEGHPRIRSSAVVVATAPPAVVAAAAAIPATRYETDNDRGPRALQAQVENDACSAAIFITSAARSPAAHAGTIANSTADFVRGSCGAYSDANGVWYAFAPPKDGIYTATVNAGLGVRIYTGGCDELTCLSELDSTHSFIGNVGVEYKFLISDEGFREEGTSFVFILNDRDSTLPPTGPPPPTFMPSGSPSGVVSVVPPSANPIGSASSLLQNAITAAPATVRLTRPPITARPSEKPVGAAQIIAPPPTTAEPTVKPSMNVEQIAEKPTVATAASSATVTKPSPDPMITVSPVMAIVGGTKEPPTASDCADRNPIFTSKSAKRHGPSDDDDGDALDDISRLSKSDKSSKTSKSGKICHSSKGTKVLKTKAAGNEPKAGKHYDSSGKRVVGKVDKGDGVSSNGVFGVSKLERVHTTFPNGAGRLQCAGYAGVLSILILMCL